MDVSGSLTAKGTVTQPVVFTSYWDDRFGGDTNGDGNQSIDTRNGGAALEIKDNASVVLEYVLTTNHETGFHVGQNSLTTVANSKVVNTDAAFEVDSTFIEDEFITHLYGELPCAPPFSSRVDVQSTWFGASGYIGASVDLASFGGAVVEQISDSPATEAQYGIMADQANMTISDASNTRPWTLYECTLPGTEVGLKFPFTPVLVYGQPSTEWLSSYGQNE
jgi:hypothetical protein